MIDVNRDVNLHNDEMKSLTRQSKGRYMLALKEGRIPQRKGHPPYLEFEELKFLQNKIFLETAMNHTLKLKEVAYIVCFSITYLFI
jgi:hypothetical protein